MAEAQDHAPTGAGKRKRGERTSPNDTRRTKRNAAAQAAAIQATEVANAFIQNAVDAAANADVNNVNAADFAALQAAAENDHPSPDAAAASSTAAAALGTMYPGLHVPQPGVDSFATAEGDTGQESPYADTPADAIGHPVTGIPPPTNGVGYKSSRPVVGSQEWHKLRKDNHKEVERRRRETINEGINELAKIVPNCEKNKGSILQRAVQYITQIKDNEAQSIEKWTLEKLLTEQAISELSATNDKLKAEIEQRKSESESMRREFQIWKRVAQNAGLEPSKEDIAAS